MMAFIKEQYKVAVVSCIIIMPALYVLLFFTCPDELSKNAYQRQRERAALPTSHTPSTCTCPGKAFNLTGLFTKNEYAEVQSRRAKEFEHYKARTTSVLSKLLFAEPNSPLQYPIQGFTVLPLTSTLIPGLKLYAGDRSSYKVTLKVSKGVLTTEKPPGDVILEGAGTGMLTIESNNLFLVNYLLSSVSYKSTVYHIHTGDLAHFRFEDSEAVFPITIKQPQIPILYDMGTDISSQVTVVTKTFIRYSSLHVLLKSIRDFYKNITVIVADDSFEPEKITEDNTKHFIMPPAQGWFAGRNLVVSQVTTKYFLWVDDDFLFTEKTKIEELVTIMEAVPELDVLGGSVNQNTFHFTLLYEEGEEMEGGCLRRKSGGVLKALPGFPHCSYVHGVVNFFLARTDAVRKVGFDPELRRVAHSEFFMDGLGSLMVATCKHVSIGHQSKKGVKNIKQYGRFRHPGKGDSNMKLRAHFYKNHLKCIHYG